MQDITNHVDIQTFNAKKIKRENNMKVKIDIFSPSRFAAKTEYSEEFVAIVKSFDKVFWDPDQKCWTLPINEHRTFEKKLTENKFIHYDEKFYNKKNQFKNSVFLKMDHTDFSIDQYINDLYANSKNAKIYLYIDKYTKSFGSLLESLNLLEGNLSFYKLKACFIFEGKINILLDFFKARFFDVNFEYVNKIKQEKPKTLF
jgi:hypothetical protein